MKKLKYKLLLGIVAFMAASLTSCTQKRPTGELIKIQIANNPDKTTFYVGETFDPKGMVINGVYTDQSIEIKDYDYSPKSALDKTNLEISIFYEDKSTSLPIIVIDQGEVALEKIVVSTMPDKTSYTVGETFDKTGMVVTAFYTDGSSKKIRNFTIEPSGALQTTDTFITVSYSEKITQVPITVKTAGGDETGYYKDINPSDSEEKLLASLQSLNSSKRKFTPGYKNLKNYYAQTDPGTKSGEITAFYAGVSKTYSSMNKEHVWPDSLGGSKVEGDLHMPRPTLTSDNSSRGNEYYVEGKHGPSKPYKETGWDPGAFDFLEESYRGDAARIVFYCCVANDQLKLVDTNGSSKPSNTMGKLSDLLKWNLKYSVLEREKVRNEEIEKIQGNRNPFIDHPEYACKIWGTTNSATRQICGM